MRTLVLLPVWAWLALFVAVPVAILAAISVAQSIPGVPPFVLALDPSSWAGLVDVYYLRGALGSLTVAAVASALCLLIGYPMALAIARGAERRRPLLLLLVILPFWTGFLLRITAWIAILRDDGWANAALAWLGFGRLVLLHTDFAMYCGIVYAYLPFMILPLVATLTRIDPALEAAAADLGASPARVFGAVTLPLSLPGIWAGLALVFLPVTGEYVIPELLGGPGSQTIGRVLWEEFFANRDWPTASALALALLAALLLPAWALRRLSGPGPLARDG